MSFIVDGKAEPTPGMLSYSFLDDEKYRLTSEDRAARPKVRVRSIVLHTTQGKWPQAVWPSARAGGGALANIHHWSKDKRCAGSHLLVDQDGVVICAADLASEQTWHATTINAYSIGIEIVQRSDGSLTRPQLEAVVLACDWITRRFRIQRQTPDAFRGAVKRLVDGGRNFVGVCGHRDQSNNRGRGDPGDVVFDMLDEAGYERFNVLANGDLAAWKPRQAALGFAGKDVDGIPLNATCDALERAGHKWGLWTPRPGD
jgi:hypothetical protein